MRKRPAVKRDVLPDPIYNSKVVTKLVNRLMRDGKKGTAQTILYDAFEIIKEKTNEEDKSEIKQDVKEVGRDYTEVVNNSLNKILILIFIIFVLNKILNRVKNSLG